MGQFIEEDEFHEEETNILTGEVLKSKHKSRRVYSTKTKLPKEEPFVKTYFEKHREYYKDTNFLGGIGLYMYNKIPYSDQPMTVIISLEEKKEIAELTGKTSYRSVDKAIKELIRKDLMIEVEKNKYMFNPYYWARGTWAQILDKRAEYDNAKLKLKGEL